MTLATVLENLIERLRFSTESRVFGVCSALGQHLGIASSSIRLWFIYASFLTFGSPVVVYFGLAFLQDIRKHLRRSRATIWDI